MEQMFVVTLREGIEAFLIVAFAATYLIKTGREALLPAVWSGAVTAVAASIVLGVWLADSAVQPAWGGLLASVAALLVISMVVYMMRMAQHLRTEIGAKLETAARKPGVGAWIGVFLFVVLMITREGMEAAFITAALARQAGASSLLWGALLGILAASALALAWVRYGHRVNLRLFFQVTSIFLVLFSVQLLVYGFHEFTEAGMLPIDNAYWHQATEDWAEGAYAQIYGTLLVLAPLAWLAWAGWRGRRMPQRA